MAFGRKNMVEGNLCDIARRKIRKQAVERKSHVLQAPTINVSELSGTEGLTPITPRFRLTHLDKSHLASVIECTCTATFIVGIWETVFMVVSAVYGMPPEIPADAALSHSIASAIASRVRSDEISGPGSKTINGGYLCDGFYALRALRAVADMSSGQAGVRVRASLFFGGDIGVDNGAGVDMDVADSGRWIEVAAACLRRVEALQKRCNSACAAVTVANSAATDRTGSKRDEGLRTGTGTGGENWNLSTSQSFSGPRDGLLRAGVAASPVKKTRVLTGAVKPSPEKNSAARLLLESLQADENIKVAKDSGLSKVWADIVASTGLFAQSQKKNGDASAASGIQKTIEGTLQGLWKTNEQRVKKPNGMRKVAKEVFADFALFKLSVESVSKLLVAATAGGEDKYGTIHRDIPVVLECLINCLIAVEAFAAHPGSLDVSLQGQMVLAEPMAAVHGKFDLLKSPTHMEEVLARIPEWSKDERMAALFSRIPPRDVNPTVHDSRVRFWSKTIVAAAQAGVLLGPEDSCKLVFDSRPEALATQFTRKGLSPLGMETVVAAMKSSGTLMAATLYLKRRGGLVGVNSAVTSDEQSVDGAVNMDRVSAFAHASLAFATGTVWRVMTAVIGSFGSIFDEDVEGNQLKDCVVVPAVVEELAVRVCNRVRREAVYSTDYLRDVARLSAEENLTRVDTLVMLRCLEVTRKASVLYDSHGNPQFVKFLQRTTDATSNKITKADIGILRIVRTRAAIEKQIGALESRVSELSKSALAAVGEGQKTRALAHLRQKREVAAILDKRTGTLHTLEVILSKIQQAETDVEVLAAYDAGTKTLENILALPGMTLEAVSNTMESLEDALGQQDEIENALMQGNESIAENGDPKFSEELEKQLEDLVASSREEEHTGESQGTMEALIGQLEGLSVVSVGISLPNVDAAERAGNAEGELADASGKERRYVLAADAETHLPQRLRLSYIAYPALHPSVRGHSRSPNQQLEMDLDVELALLADSANPNANAFNTNDINSHSSSASNNHNAFTLIESNNVNSDDDGMDILAEIEEECSGLGLQSGAAVSTTFSEATSGASQLSRPRSLTSTAMGISPDTARRRRRDSSVSSSASSSTTDSSSSRSSESIHEDYASSNTVATPIFPQGSLQGKKPTADVSSHPSLSLSSSHPVTEHLQTATKDEPLHSAITASAISSVSVLESDLRKKLEVAQIALKEKDAMISRLNALQKSSSAVPQDTSNQSLIKSLRADIKRLSDALKSQKQEMTKIESTKLAIEKKFAELEKKHSDALDENDRLRSELKKLEKGSAESSSSGRDREVRRTLDTTKAELRRVSDDLNTEKANHAVTVAERDGAVANLDSTRIVLQQTNNELTLAKEENKKLKERVVHLNIEVERLSSEFLAEKEQMLRQNPNTGNNDDAASSSSTGDEFGKVSSMAGQIMTLQRTVMQLEKEKLVLQDALTRHLVERYEMESVRGPQQQTSLEHETPKIPQTQSKINSNSSNSSSTSLDDLRLSQPLIQSALPISPQYTSSSKESGAKSRSLPNQKSSDEASCPARYPFQHQSLNRVRRGSVVSSNTSEAVTSTAGSGQQQHGVNKVISKRKIPATMSEATSAPASGTSTPVGTPNLLDPNESSVVPNKTVKSKPAPINQSVVPPGTKDKAKHSTDIQTSVPQKRSQAALESSSSPASLQSASNPPSSRGTNQLPAFKKSKFIISESSKKQVLSGTSSKSDTVSDHSLPIKSYSARGRDGTTDERATRNAGTSPSVSGSKQNVSKGNPSSRSLESLSSTESSSLSKPARQGRESHEIAALVRPPRPLTAQNLSSWIKNASFAKLESNACSPWVMAVSNDPKSFGSGRFDFLMRDILLQMLRDRNTGNGSKGRTSKSDLWEWCELLRDFEEGEEVEVVSVPYRNGDRTLESGIPQDERNVTWFFWVLGSAVNRDQSNFFNQIFSWVEDTILGADGLSMEPAILCRITRFYSSLCRLHAPKEFKRVHKFATSILSSFRTVKRTAISLVDGVAGVWPEAFDFRPKNSEDNGKLVPDVVIETGCVIALQTVNELVAEGYSSVANMCHWAKTAIDPNWLSPTEATGLMENLTINLSRMYFFSTGISPAELAKAREAIVTMVLAFSTRDAAEFLENLYAVAEDRETSGRVVEVVRETVTAFARVCARDPRDSSALDVQRMVVVYFVDEFGAEAVHDDLKRELVHGVLEAFVGNETGNCDPLVAEKVKV
ncbi:Charged multivesicular body protein 7 [Entophlyctis luteolus]|nr:Charged multivesicular body protein 7 [Entophlyctis luteolus]